ncbi:MAG: polysaccharide biosynthesis/export family protein [Oxalobacteraceae bacterium]|jgi:polysaccharide export outer membrane protein|nr:polysaccharide biosynthesis/export family protein [Oxalobacteraceae bacterium]
MRSRGLAVGVVVWLSACTAMAPGIQFGKAQPASTEADAADADAVVSPAEILAITPRLVRQEKALRDQQIAEDITALLQPAQIYRIEAGDVLHIVVWDHPELSASMLPAGVPGAVGVAGVAVSPMQPQSGFEIDQQGMLDFPYAGKLKVAGLTAVEAHEQLIRRLSHYLKHPKVTLRVLTYRSKRVYVDGEVKQPGVQAINDLPMTLTEAINRAGGVTPMADQSRIMVSREGKTYQINMPQLVQRGVNPSAIMLASGDVVRVLSRDETKIFISGEVTSPRALPMRNGRLTLNEALGEAGGINPVTGDARQVYVVRRNSQSSVVYQLDANAPGALAMAEGFELNPRDVVYVAATPLTNWNRTISAMIPGALPTAVIATTPGR